MATIKFHLDQRSKRKDGRFPLKLSITHKQSSTLISLNVFLFSENWNKNTGLIINHPKKQFLNSYLAKLSLDVETELLNMLSEGTLARLNISEIKKEIIKRVITEEVPEEKTQSFENRFKSYAQNKSNKRTREIYEVTLKKIINFAGDISSWRFEDITVVWLKSFEKHLSKSVPSANGRAIHFRNLRAVFNEAIIILL